MQKALITEIAGKCKQHLALENANGILNSNSRKLQMALTVENANGILNRNNKQT